MRGRIRSWPRGPVELTVRSAAPSSHGAHPFARASCPQNQHAGVVERRSRLGTYVSTWPLTNLGSSAPPAEGGSTFETGRRGCPLRCRVWSWPLMVRRIFSTWTAYYVFDEVSRLLRRIARAPSLHKRLRRMRGGLRSALSTPSRSGSGSRAPLDASPALGARAHAPQLTGRRATDMSKKFAG
jgi:hypothetical protein